MKLGVIMPAWNRETTISAALRSLLRQGDAADLDIIVVDDGSTDGTAAVVAEMARSTPALRLVRQENRGVTRARNAGVAALAGDTDLVTFLDSDDISPAGRFAADIAHFRDDPELELVYGRMSIVDEIDEATLAPFPDGWSVTVRGIQLGAGIYRRHLVERLGGFDESFEQGEDTDFLFRLFEQRPRVHFSDVVAVLYRRHPGNLTKDEATSRRFWMRAVMGSIRRRKADPALASLDGIFDVTPLAGVEWVRRAGTQ